MQTSGNDFSLSDRPKNFLKKFVVTIDITTKVRYNIVVT